MSFLPLSGCLGLALGFFQVPIRVEDIVMTTSDGQDNQASYAARTIQGAIDPTNRKQLEIIFGGDVPNGSIGIYTNEILYFDDMYQPGDLRMQSFIAFQDATYRIIRKADWTQQTGFYVYLAEYHVQQGGII